MNINDVLNQCEISGNIVTLPDIQLERKLYQEVAKKIELIGGKWNRGAKGFIFKQNPNELFEAIKNGEKKDIKKEYQFFETPESLADELVNHLPDSIWSVLEPSAGQGAIVRAINKKRPDTNVCYCELMELNRMQFVGSSLYLNDDFLTLSPDFKFDAVIANPPFAKNQDIDHFYKMMEHAEKIVISVMSNHWRNSKNKKETYFRNYLDSLDYKLLEIPEGTFKESGTNIAACVLVVKK